MYRRLCRHFCLDHLCSRLDPDSGQDLLARMGRDDLCLCSRCVIRSCLLERKANRAVFTLVIAVALQDRPAAAPQTGPWDKQLIISASPTFAALGSTLGGIIFTLAGTPAFVTSFHAARTRLTIRFFGIVSEMRLPEKFVKTLIWCQAIITAMCIFCGVMVYYYCGIYVASPVSIPFLHSSECPWPGYREADVQAPGSAGVLLKKITYGLGFPGILMSTVVYTHVSHWPVLRLRSFERRSDRDSSRPSTSLSRSSAARHTSRPTPGNTGSSGSHVPAASASSRTSSRAGSPSSPPSPRSSALSSDRCCHLSPWACSTCATIGSRARIGPCRTVCGALGHWAWCFSGSSARFRERTGRSSISMRLSSRAS